MAFSLAKVPRGLLELLNARTTGRTLSASQEFLQPTLEMRDFYASSQLMGSGGSPVTGAIAPALEATLTFTGSWLGVRAISGSLTIGAAAATNITFDWGFIFTNNTTRTGVGGTFVAQAGIGNVVGFASGPLPFIVPPGTAIYARCSGTAAGADHALRVNALIENYTLQG